jgi:hypothetical protein
MSSLVFNPLTGKFDVVVDTTRRNLREFIYIKGNENTDGSMRIIPDAEGVEDRVELQRRDNGVWLHAAVDVAGTTAISMGDGLLVGSAGPHFKTEDTGSGFTYLHSETQFSEANGSAEAAVSPNLSAKTTRSILQADNSGELSGNVVSWTVNIDVPRLITRLYLDVTVAATDNARLTITSTGSTSGIDFAQNVGASDLAFGEQYIDLDGWVEEAERGVDVVFTLTVDNGGTMAIAADVNDLVAWYAYDYFVMAHKITAPMDVLAERMMFDRATHEPILSTTGCMFMTKPSIEV